MELDFINNKIFPSDGVKIFHHNSPLSTDIGDVINQMGVASARTQNLYSAITNVDKFRCSDDHKLYIFVRECSAIGYLRTGRKHLFITNADGRYREITPLCVLDFYVHEKFQRAGIGKIIFDKMLKDENSISASKLAYDRPSNMLRFFLKAHYGLHDFTPQANNFVVFHSYFRKESKYDRDDKLKTYTNHHAANKGGFNIDCSENTRLNSYVGSNSSSDNNTSTSRTHSSISGTSSSNTEVTGVERVIPPKFIRTSSSHTTAARKNSSAREYTYNPGRCTDKTLSQTYPYGATTTGTSTPINTKNSSREEVAYNPSRTHVSTSGDPWLVKGSSLLGRNANVLGITDLATEKRDKLMFSKSTLRRPF